MSIGERISELRKASEISQYELAKSMDVTRQAVSKWENDQSCPDAMNLIRLAEILDTDIEYLATGRRNFGRRPPIVIKTTETVEKIVEKPVVQVVEKIIERPIPSPAEVQIVEKPVLKKVYRTKYVINPYLLTIVGTVCFFIGLIIGRFS